jgi:hypothetical protein
VRFCQFKNDFAESFCLCCRKALENVFSVLAAKSGAVSRDVASLNRLIDAVHKDNEIVASFLEMVCVFELF